VRGGSSDVRRAPSVTEYQAGCLRFARDNREVRPQHYNPSVLRSCRHHRWLAPRGDHGEYFVITDSGRAALAYYDADVMMEKLWEGRRG
jgi:hypothetical protein